MRRLATVLLALALVTLAGVAQAQPRPTAAQLQRLIAEALKDPDSVTITRTQSLGFTERVVTRQLTYERGGVHYTLAVTNPRLRDGLIFFSHQPARKLFIMHRTDTHLRRVASARNDLTQGDAGLTRWDGQAADNDFSAQLAFWATVN